MQYHKYSLTEIENMIPWEREIYLALLKDHIETENLKRQQREGKNECAKITVAKLFETVAEVDKRSQVALMQSEDAFKFLRIQEQI